MGVDCEQLALLQRDGADVDKCTFSASAERVTEQNGLSTAMDIYCMPWKKCRTERNLSDSLIQLRLTHTEKSVSLFRKNRNMKLRGKYIFIKVERLNIFS